MASNFQPDDPSPKTKGPTPVGNTSIFVVAVISALMVIMLLAILAPRAFGDSRWLITIGAGVLVGLGVAGFGLARRRRSS